MWYRFVYNKYMYDPSDFDGEVQGERMGYDVIVPVDCCAQRRVGFTPSKKKKLYIYMTGQRSNPYKSNERNKNNNKIL